MLTVGDVMLDLRQRLVTYRGEPAALTAREYAVVELLMRKAGCLATRAEIEEELYGFEDDIGSNAIEVHIHNLRRKLGPALHHQRQGTRLSRRQWPLEPRGRGRCAGAWRSPSRSRPAWCFDSGIPRLSRGGEQYGCAV